MRTCSAVHSEQHATYASPMQGAACAMVVVVRCLLLSHMGLDALHQHAAICAAAAQ